MSIVFAVAIGINVPGRLNFKLSFVDILGHNIFKIELIFDIQRPVFDHFIFTDFFEVRGCVNSQKRLPSDSKNKPTTNQAPLLHLILQFTLPVEEMTMQ